jgi:hypothetical protein
MSTHNRVRRKVNFMIDAALNFEEEELVETGGISFSDGHCIELIKDDVGSLTFLDSKSKEFYQRINLAGIGYVPPILSPSVLEALTLPTKRIDCGSTVDIFGEICNFFLCYGVSEDAARASTYFVFASWFPETLPLAPCLKLSGTEAEARFLLQLLTCVVRHALPLAEFNLAIFHCLPMHLQPTMLIGHVHPSMWRLFSASNHPQTYVPNKYGLTDLYCAKAAYAGSNSCGGDDDSILNIECVLQDGKLPVINRAVLGKKAAYFQPKLLDYRLKHIAHVQNADFDATALPIPLRMLARTLGSCIVDAPELRADIVCLLEKQEELVSANRSFDSICVTIEAMFAHCHRENGIIRVGVNEIAKTATAILADRGEADVLESKKTGRHLRDLGFRAKRDSKGFAIHLRPELRRRIHRLARDHRVGDLEQPVPGCPDCVDLVSAQIGASNS